MGENYNSIVMLEFDWIVSEDRYTGKGLIRWNIKIHEYLDRVGESKYRMSIYLLMTFLFFFLLLFFGRKIEFSLHRKFMQMFEYMRESKFWVSLRVIKKDTFNLHLIFK